MIDIKIPNIPPRGNHKTYTCNYSYLQIPFTIFQFLIYYEKKKEWEEGDNEKMHFC